MLELLYYVRAFAFALKWSGMPLKGFIQGSVMRYGCKIILPIGSGWLWKQGLGQIVTDWEKS